MFTGLGFLRLGFQAGETLIKFWGLFNALMKRAGLTPWKN
jgi:hypothetical protein